MKVMVVDDEKLINEYIVKCIRDADCGAEIVGSALSGAKALQLLRQVHADVVFADITMPRMDGLELLRNIKAAFPTVDVAMLTCHDEFDYARRAMQYQAADYILKNELTPELLQSTFAKLRKKRAQQTTLHEVRRVSRNRFLRQLIDESDHMYPVRLEDLRNNQIDLENRAFLVAIFRNEPYNYDLIRETWGDQMENPSFCMDSNCLYLLANLPYGISREDEAAYFDAMLACGRQLHGAFGCSRIYHHLERLPSAVLGAIRARNAGFYQLPPESYELPPRDPEEAEAFIIRAAAASFAGDMVTGCQELEALLKFAGESHPRVAFLTEPLAPLIEALGKRSGFDFTESCQRILEAKTFCQLREETHRVLERIAMVSRRYSAPIQQALTYVSQHYAEDISLNTVADMVFLNRDYLSRQFKKEVGVNFSEYLTRCRMEQAKQLIERTSLRVSDIALEVGIPNMSYFSTVFHRVFGCSPNEARRSAKGG